MNNPTTLEKYKIKILPMRGRALKIFYRINFYDKNWLYTHCVDFDSLEKLIEYINKELNNE